MFENKNYIEKIAKELFPIFRSITGEGVRETIDIISREIPVTKKSISSGEKVFDWKVPLEWKFNHAFLKDAEGNILIDASKNNLNLLIKTQGIGKRIAERLIIELKNKLQKFKKDKESNIENKKTKQSNHFVKYIEEIRSILNSLGYLDNEIKDSIELISSNQKENSLLISSLSAEEKTELMDKHLKEILIKLSQKGT